MRTENLPFECLKCEQNFISPDILQYHIDHGHLNTSEKKNAATRKGKQVKECKLCYKRFKNHIILSKHERLVHKQEKNLNHEITKTDLKHACNICERAL